MHGDVERAVADLSVKAVVDLEKRRAAVGLDALSEVDNQFQVEVVGTAVPTWGFIDLAVPFDVGFVMAREQRDSALTMPQFSYGAVLTLDPPEDGVAVSVVVIGWDIDPDIRSYIGATVRLGFVSIQDGGVSFSGHIHLTFQGFGAALEDNYASDIDTGT